jgi:hypothetical protein
MEIAAWLTEGMVRKGRGEEVWTGSFDALGEAAPSSVPLAVWTTIVEVARRDRDRLAESEPKGTPSAGERRVISRRVSLERVPLTRVDYTFADKPFAFVVIGSTGTERFWAQEFPPRWSRVNRFLKALARDLQREGLADWSSRPEDTPFRNLDDFRARKASGGGTADSAAGPETPSRPASSIRIQEVKDTDEQSGEDG